MGIIDIDKVSQLDKMLEVMQKRNVASCAFHPDGSVAQVLFKYTETDFLAGAPGPAQPARVLSMVPGEKPVEAQRKESDIDLALNPPNDVRYPVDDGKE